MSRSLRLSRMRIADNTQELVSLVAERSASSPDRPKMSPAAEERLREIDRRDAACYAEAELIALRLKRATEALQEADGVPIAELDSADSIVTSATDLKVAVAPLR